MLLSRRDLVGSIAAAATIPWSGAALAQPVRTRRNLAGMSPGDPDLAALITGISAMRSRVDSLSYEFQRQIHANWAAQHGTWRFLPWHRVQLAAFEQIIAVLSGKPDFALPYWDWQQTPKLPSFMFSHPVLGVSGRLATPATDFKARRWGEDPNYARVLADDFWTFAGQPNAAGRVEGYGHNIIHVVVGGPMGSPPTATLDPLFWMHHANIDRVWSTWHRHLPRPYPNAFQSEQLTGFVGPAGPLPPIYAGQILDTSSFGYDYDQPYPFPTFSITLAAPPGTTKRSFVGQRDFFATATNAGGDSRSIELPAEAVAALRADRDQLLEPEATGSVRMSTAGLKDRVVRIIASAPEGGADGHPPPQKVVLAAVPAFFHDSATAGAHGDAHPSQWGFVYKVGPEMVDLIGTSRGKVMLDVDTVPVSGAPDGFRATVVDFTLGLKLRQFQWR